MNAATRNHMIRLASEFPAGSRERREILAFFPLKTITSLPPSSKLHHTPASHGKPGSDLTPEEAETKKKEDADSVRTESIRWIERKESKALRSELTDELLANFKRENPGAHKKLETLISAQADLDEINHEIRQLESSVKYEKRPKEKKTLQSDLDDLNKQKTKSDKKVETLSRDSSLKDIMSDLDKVDKASLKELQGAAKALVADEDESDGGDDRKDKGKATESAKLEFQTYKKKHPQTEKSWRDFLPSWLGGPKKKASFDMSDRIELIRIASELPVGNETRRAVLAGLTRSATYTDRSSILPIEARYELPFTPQGTDLEIWKWQDARGRSMAIVFQGSSMKPLWYRAFTSEASRERDVHEITDARRSALKAKLDQAQTRKESQHEFNLGDILTASWGYNQTNVNYFQVTSVAGKSLVIREIDKNVHHSDTYNDYVVPVKDHFIGPSLKKIPQVLGNSVTVKIDGSIRARAWDGKPQRQTGFGFGN